ncbi:unnamed protein product [Rotaria sordida]|uniref:Dual specificity phosphatase catalytic domain-containing protein n=1 Tax=Rotaria sordida TaxID=392033 RepID=A0A819JHI8_9BILA|nr:unnamed protein product [Rotaria sordida]
MGISRSSTIVLAYLLRHHHEDLRKAYDYLVERRCIALPNNGFFLQLIRYENDLLQIQNSETKQYSNRST